MSVAYLSMRNLTAIVRLLNALYKIIILLKTAHTSRNISFDVNKRAECIQIKIAHQGHWLT